VPQPDATSAVRALGAAIAAAPSRLAGPPGVVNPLPH
jgi:hypothetical protein